MTVDGWVGEEEEEWAACELRTADGTPVPMTFTAMGRAGDGAYSFGSVGRSLCLTKPSVTTTHLAPGEYTLTVRLPGRDPVTQEVYLEAGRTTELTLFP